MSDILRKRAAMATNPTARDVDRYGISMAQSGALSNREHFDIALSASRSDLAKNECRNSPASRGSDTFHTARTFEVATEKGGRKLMSEEEVSNLVHNALRRARQATGQAASGSVSSTSPRHRARQNPLSPLTTASPSTIASPRPPTSPFKSSSILLPGDGELHLDTSFPRHRGARVELPARYTSNVETEAFDFTTATIDGTVSNISVDGSDYNQTHLSESRSDDSTSDFPKVTTANSSDEIIRRVEEEIANARRAAQEANRRLAGVSANFRFTTVQESSDNEKTSSQEFEWPNETSDDEMKLPERPQPSDGSSGPSTGHSILQNDSEFMLSRLDSGIINALSHDLDDGERYGYPSFDTDRSSEVERSRSIEKVESATTVDSSIRGDVTLVDFISGDTINEPDETKSVNREHEEKALIVERKSDDLSAPDLTHLEPESIDKERYIAPPRHQSFDGAASDTSTRTVEVQPVTRNHLKSKASTPKDRTEFPSHFSAQGNIIMRLLAQAEEETRPPETRAPEVTTHDQAVQDASCHSCHLVIDLTRVESDGTHITVAGFDPDTVESKGSVICHKDSAESSQGCPLEYQFPREASADQIQASPKDIEHESFQQTYPSLLVERTRTVGINEHGIAVSLPSKQEDSDAADERFATVGAASYEIMDPISSDDSAQGTEDDDDIKGWEPPLNDQILVKENDYIEMIAPRSVEERTGADSYERDQDDQDPEINNEFSHCHSLTSNDASTAMDTEQVSDHSLPCLSACKDIAPVSFDSPPSFNIREDMEHESDVSPLVILSASREDEKVYDDSPPDTKASVIDGQVYDGTPPSLNASRDNEQAYEDSLPLLNASRDNEQVYEDSLPSYSASRDNEQAYEDALSSFNASRDNGQAYDDSLPLYNASRDNEQTYDDSTPSCNASKSNEQAYDDSLPSCNASIDNEQTYDDSLPLYKASRENEQAADNSLPLYNASRDNEQAADDSLPLYNASRDNEQEVDKSPRVESVASIETEQENDHTSPALSTGERVEQVTDESLPFSVCDDTEHLGDNPSPPFTISNETEQLIDESKGKETNTLAECPANHSVAEHDCDSDDDVFADVEETHAKGMVTTEVENTEALETAIDDIAAEDMEHTDKKYADDSDAVTQLIANSGESLSSDDGTQNNFESENTPQIDEVRVKSEDEEEIKADPCEDVSKKFLCTSSEVKQSATITGEEASSSGQATPTLLGTVETTTSEEVLTHEKPQQPVNARSNKKVRFKQRYPVPPLVSKPRGPDEISKDHRVPHVASSPFLSKPKPDLLQLLQAAVGSSLQRRSNACGALKVLTTMKKNQLTLVRTAGFLDALVFAASSRISKHDVESSRDARTRAVCAICHISEPKDNREIIFCHPGLVAALIQAVKEDKAEARMEACGAIAFLAKTPSNREPMAKTTNMLDVLATLLKKRKTETDIANDPISSYSIEDEESDRQSFSSESDSSSSSIENESSLSNDEDEITLPTVASMRELNVSKLGETNQRAHLNACAALLHISKQCGATVSKQQSLERHVCIVVQLRLTDFFAFFGLKSLMCCNAKLMDALVELSHNEKDPMNEKCLEILCNLSRFPANNELMSQFPGLVDCLVVNGSSSYGQRRVWSLRILQNLSTDAIGKTILANRVVLELLSFSVMRENLDEQLAATATLYNLSTEPGAVVSLTNTKNVVATLVHVAHNPESASEVRLMACDALATLGLWLQTLAGAGTVPAEIDDTVTLPSYVTSGWERWE